MSKTINITDLSLPYEIDTEKEYDDDGCGSPSKTGNSMTGSRGSYYTAIGVRCTLSDKELRKLVEDAMWEQNEERLNEEAAEDGELAEYDEDGDPNDCD